MAFPRRHTRRIVVGGTTYLWYLRDNEAWEAGKHISVHRSDCRGGQLMLLDPYPHDVEIRPRMVREAIEFALANGWLSAHRPTKPLYVGYDARGFVLLPPGQQYTVQTPKRAP